MDVVAHFKGARNVTSIPSGLVLFREGEPGKEMFILMQGTSGALLGEMALVDSSARSATVITRSDCKFVAVDGRQFDLLVRESPEFARHVMTVMANRLRTMNDRLKEAISEVGVHGRRPR